jgi:hypothetical protein
MMIWAHPAVATANAILVKPARSGKGRPMLASDCYWAV